MKSVTVEIPFGHHLEPQGDGTFKVVEDKIETPTPCEWFMAVCKSGKISEIQQILSPRGEKIAPPLMLPPCSSDDMPAWVQVIEMDANLVLQNRITELENELSALKAEREKVASGKLTCADCGSILSRW